MRRIRLFTLLLLVAATGCYFLSWTGASAIFALLGMLLEAGFWIGELYKDRGDVDGHDDSPKR